MTRTTLDYVVGATVAAIVVLGALATIDGYRRRTAHEAMMGHAHGPTPLWWLLGTLVLAAVVGVGYLLVREQLQPEVGEHEKETRTGSPDGGQATAGAGSVADESPTAADATADSVTGGSVRPAVLDVLPDDERRILEPVIESPGLTQIALRDRSEFSKSKVSQTVTDLEKRGLLYRERQGRTYRVYPGEDLLER